MILGHRRIAAFVSLLLSSTAVIPASHGQGRGDYDSSKQYQAPREAPQKVPLDMSKERQRWLFARACDSSVSTWEGGGDWVLCTGFAGDGTPAGKGHLFLADRAIAAGPGKTIKDASTAGAVCELDITYVESAGVRPVLVCEFLGADLAKQQIRILADGADVARFTPTAKVERYELAPAFGGDGRRMAALRNIEVILTIGGKSVTLLKARVSDLRAGISTMIRAVNDQDALAALAAPAPGSRRPEKSCFLTEACCAMVGLPDDCFELTALRRYRDRVLAPSPGGAAEVGLYYALAPVLLPVLRRERDGRTLLRLYFTHILPCALLATLGLNGAVHRRYRDMLVRLCARLAPAWLPLVQRATASAIP